MTEYHASYFAHELSKRHSINDSEKLATALADAQVDLNPHQLDAALFAFRSPLSKGSILADEVGLGKTIEAGLVISQKWAEKKRRILIITPANLRKQWAMEMMEKFYLPAIILETKNYNQMVKDGIKRPLSQECLVICSYQFAAKNYNKIMLEPWNLAVIDESHRLRNVYKADNKIAKAIKNALLNTPKILLTATPLQNSLMELYGLVSIIDDYAFGDEKSFKAQYARLSGESTFDELKSRLAPLCHRTLRRQVLEYIRYTNRIPLTEDFFPTDDEMALYDMVTEYLQRDALYALPNSQRQLITLILRKLLASSTFAIAGALESLINRLKKILMEAKFNGEIDEIQNDFEEFEVEAEEWEEDDTTETLTLDDKAAIESEIKELEFFRDAAVGITENAKGNALISALSHGFKKAVELGSAEKAIVFTESRKTQNYLINLLSENGYKDKIVLFNGTNADPQSKAIYATWLEKHKGTDRVSGSKTADMRTALVDQFRETAQIMIATEAGAEGINLQFCSMVVNYDLPWNPQRIEQRIGRCHRYGQKHDVVVINFINRKNAADQRVFELLDQKFKLFSGVFGASDEVLGTIESGVDFEKRIANIYQNCRTTSDIELEFNRLQDEMESQITATMSDTRKKLLENFDADVHDRLRVNLHESREYLNKYDTMLWNLTRFNLAGNATFHPETLSFNLTNALSVDIPAGNYTLTRGEVSTHRYRIGHPLAQKIIAESKGKTLSGGHIRFDYSSWYQKSDSVAVLLGQSGQLSLYLLAINGADEQDHIILSALSDNGELLSQETTRRFFDLPAEIVDRQEVAQSTALKAATERRINEILLEISAGQASWFEEEIEKLNFWAEDKRRGLKSELKDYDEQIAVLKKEARLAANLPDKLAIQKKLRELDSKRDIAWKAYDADAKQIEKQKDELLDTVEARLKQTIEEKTIFTIRWSVV
jgi:ERCC4-related helicase